jgi:GNAT superfamily N-acetyltransferase
MKYRIRAACPNDVPELVRMCFEHASYERATFDPRNKEAQLADALFSSTPKLAAWVAEADGALVGYATGMIEFSTWAGGIYVHMDCLFVRDGLRGLGVGAKLLECVTLFARNSGALEVQWQTPVWNLDAARFYERAGASSSQKLRFTLALADPGNSRVSRGLGRGAPG